MASTCSIPCSVRQVTNGWTCTPSADLSAALIVPETQIEQIRYFTAPILGSMATDPKAEHRQALYHRALKANGIEIIKGFHNKAITTGLLVKPDGKLDCSQRVKVQVMEEKQTDVNIGLQLYRDVARVHCEQVILCSNDADLEPALKLVRADYPEIQIGLILPVSSNNHRARRSTRLQAHAHWVRHSVHDDELARCQYPDHLLDHRRHSIHKPAEW